MPNEDKQRPPLACNLGAMTAAQRARHRVLGEALREEVQEILELPDGFTFRLPPEAWSTAAEFVLLEKLCCPFVRFQLEMSEDGGPLRLALTGREGVKEFLRAELGLGS
jgi:hypothetical protein